MAPTTYEECADLMRTARDERAGKPIGNNTRVVHSGDADLAIRLHQTDVVTFHVNGTITLDTGGWRTVTTKDRINGALPNGLRVYSDRGTWYLGKMGLGTERVAYFDGMVLTPDGEVLNGIPPEEWEAFNSESLKIRAEVKTYIDGFIAALKSDEGLPLPSGGDCWYCSLLESGTGTAMGDLGPGDSHLGEHLKESYYVPSLLLNAVKAENYGDPMFVFSLRYVEFLDGVATKLRLTRDDHGTTRRTLRKYLLARLLPAPPSVGPREPLPLDANARGLR